MKPDISILEVEQFGRCLKLGLKQELYSLHTIYAAGYIFLDKAYFILDKEKNKVIVYLFPKNKKANLEELARKFLDELINYAHYSSRAAANAEVTKAIIQKAIFSASTPLAQEVQNQETEKLVKELEKKSSP